MADGTVSPGEFRALENRVVALERQSAVDQNNGKHIDRRFDELDASIASMRRDMDKQIESMHADFTRKFDGITSLGRWALLVVGASVLGILVNWFANSGATLPIGGL